MRAVRSTTLTCCHTLHSSLFDSSLFRVMRVKYMHCQHAFSEGTPHRKGGGVNSNRTLEIQRGEGDTTRSSPWNETSKHNPNHTPPTLSPLSHARRNKFQERENAPAASSRIPLEWLTVFCQRARAKKRNLSPHHYLRLFYDVVAAAGFCVICLKINRLRAATETSHTN